LPLSYFPLPATSCYKSSLEAAAKSNAFMKNKEIENQKFKLYSNEFKVKKSKSKNQIENQNPN